MRHLLMLFAAAIAVPHAAAQEAAPCPETRTSGPFGALATIYMDAAYIGPGVAIAPDLIIAILPRDAISADRSQQITAGWFTAQTRSPITLVGYDSELKLAVFRPTEPVRACAVLADPNPYETRFLVGAHVWVKKWAILSPAAIRGDLNIPLSMTELMTVMVCKGRTCPAKFIGGIVVSVQTGRISGIVTRSGSGRVYAVRAASLRARVNHILKASAAAKTLSP